jgi:hypothetical protein
MVKIKNPKELTSGFQMRNPGRIFDPPGALRFSRFALVDLRKETKKAKERSALGSHDGFFSEWNNDGAFHSVLLILS